MSLTCFPVFNIGHRGVQGRDQALIAVVTEKVSHKPQFQEAREKAKRKKSGLPKVADRRSELAIKWRDYPG